MIRPLVRRQLLQHSRAFLLVTGVPGIARSRGSTILDPDWELYKSRYLQDNGRIVDTGNNNISHSEGQGYGLLFAATFNDEAAFTRIWHWTRETLQHRDDALHSWRWVPAEPHITDTNNASDGDLLIAWGLSRAAILWGKKEYRQASQAIFHDLAQKCVLRVGGRLLLLPGSQGFFHPKTAVINLSYYVAPALQVAAHFDSAGPWRLLLDTGVQLVQTSRFGLWGLPPDWLTVDRKSERIFPASGFPPRFSYDAIRIPLYLRWAKRLPTGLTQSIMAITKNWTLDGLPGWIDLKTGERSNYMAPQGYRAVVLFTLRGADSLPDLPTVKDSPDYYSSSLTLLSRIAAMETV